tara:strand:+ start:1827 stop:2624 length:798 start_codon:yes stop_codon:yes gene_type:complete
MKYILNLFLVATFFCTISCKEKPKEKETIDVVENWQPLFNGKDLNDWLVKIKGYPLGENPHNTFRAENGVIKVAYDGYDNFNNSFGHIFYKTPFSNYKLRMQYRFTGEQAEGGAGWAKRNSGIMIHCQPPESISLNQNFPLSIEVQLLGGIDETVKRPTGNLCTPGTNVVMDGNLKTDHCTESNSKTFYGEQWVTAEVIVKNDTITHKINNEIVLSYSKPQIGGDLSDFPEEWQAKDGELLKGGYISLQSESHPVEFKNIEILKL